MSAVEKCLLGLVLLEAVAIAVLIFRVTRIEDLLKLWRTRRR